MEKVQIFLLLFILAGSRILVDAMILDCDYALEPWTRVGDDGDEYTCIVKSLRFTDLNEENITDAIGAHSCSEFVNENEVDPVCVSLGSLEDVLAVKFDCAQIGSLGIIPGGIQNIFPNMIALGFDGCTSIESLRGSELNEYTNLVHFSMVNGNLNNIYGYLFENTPNLAYISFASNNVSSMKPFLLDELETLEEVDFSENYCINTTVSNTEDLDILLKVLLLLCPDRCIFGDSFDKSICSVQVFSFQTASIVSLLQTSTLFLSNRTDELNVTYQTIESDLSTIQDQVTTITQEDFGSDIDGLDSRLTELEGKCGGSSEDIETINQEITKLNGNITALESNFGTLQGQIDGVQGQVDALTQNDATLQGQIDGLANETQCLRDDFNNLEEKCSKLKNNLEEHVRKFNRRIRNLENENVDQKNEIQRLERKLDELLNRESCEKDSRGKSRNNSRNHNRHDNSRERHGTNSQGRNRRH